MHVWFCNKCGEVGEADTQASAEGQHREGSPNCNYYPAWNWKPTTAAPLDPEQQKFIDDIRTANAGAARREAPVASEPPTGHLQLIEALEKRQMDAVMAGGSFGVTGPELARLLMLARRGTNPAPSEIPRLILNDPYAAAIYSFARKEFETPEPSTASTPVRPSTVGAPEEATVTRSPVSASLTDAEIAAAFVTIRTAWSADDPHANASIAEAQIRAEVRRLRSRVEELEAAMRGALGEVKNLPMTESLHIAFGQLRSSLHQETE